MPVWAASTGDKHTQSQPYPRDGRGNKMKQSFQPFHFGIKTSSVFHCDPELPRLPHIQNARRQIVAAPVTNLRERRKVKYAACRLRVGWREKNSKEDLNYIAFRVLS